MRAVEALIFDLDGVITDTSDYHFLAWKRLADEEGLPFTREDNEQLRGVSRRESLLRLLKGKTLPEATLQEFMARKNGYYVDSLHNITPDNILPGVMDFLEEARAAKLKLAIGSASKNAQVVIERLGLAQWFEVIGDGFSVNNSKPAPDLFVWVAGGLHVPVSKAVVFEDAEAGIDAAKAAGFFSVGLGTANIQHADVVLPDLVSTRLSAVISQLGAAH